MGELSTATPPVPPAATRQRIAILVVLLGLAAAGWFVFLRQAAEPTGMHEDMGPDLTMGRSGADILLRKGADTSAAFPMTFGLRVT